MNKPLKLIKIGNSTGVILPKELLVRLNVAAGDQLFITDTPDGFQARRDSREFDGQLDAARELMADYRNALRELAK